MKLLIVYLFFLINLFGQEWFYVLKEDVSNKNDNHVILKENIRMFFDRTYIDELNKKYNNLNKKEIPFYDFVYSVNKNIFFEDEIYFIDINKNRFQQYEIISSYNNFYLLK